MDINLGLLIQSDVLEKLWGVGTSMSLCYNNIIIIIIIINTDTEQY